MAKGKVEIDVIIKDAQSAKTLADLDKSANTLNKELQKTKIGTKEYKMLNRTLEDTRGRLGDSTNIGKSWGQQLNSIPGIVGNVSRSFGGFFKMMKANPVASLLLILTGLIVKIIDNITLTTDTTAELGAAFSQMGAIVQPLLNFVADIITGIIKGFVNLIDNTIKWGRRLGLVSDEMEEQLKLSQDISNSEEKLRKERNKFLEEEAKLTTEINKLNDKANDSNLTRNERIEAFEKMQEKIEERSEKQLKLAQEELRIAERVSEQGNDNADDEEKLAQLKANVLKMESSGLRESTRLNKQKNTLIEQGVKEIEKQVEAQRKVREEVNKTYLSLLDDIRTQQMSNHEQELKNIDDKYSNELGRMRQLGLDTTEIEQFITDEKTRINREYQQGLESDRERLNQARMDFEISQTERENEIYLNKLVTRNTKELDFNKKLLEQKLQDETISEQEKFNMIQEFEQKKIENEERIAELKEEKEKELLEIEREAFLENLLFEQERELENFIGTEEQKKILEEQFALEREEREAEYNNKLEDLEEIHQENLLKIREKAVNDTVKLNDNLTKTIEADAKERENIEKQLQNTKEMAFMQVSDALIDVMGDDFKGAKSFAIAQAGIHGALAAQKALSELGPIAGPIAVAGIVATTAANINKIKSTTPSSSATSPSTPNINTPSTTPSGVNIDGSQTPTSATDIDFRDREERSRTEIIEAIVVKSDIDEIENIDNEIERRKRII